MTDRYIDDIFMCRRKVGIIYRHAHSFLIFSPNHHFSLSSTGNTPVDTCDESEQVFSAMSGDFVSNYV